jgi:hypothetical protein
MHTERTVRTANGMATFLEPKASTSFPMIGPSINKKKIWRVVIQAKDEDD